MALEYFNLGNGINTYSSPMQGQDGQMIHGVNVTSFPLGGLSKRPGYTSFLGNLGTQVSSLLYYPNQNNGTALTLLAAAGSLLYYSQQGTSAWAIAQGSTGGDSGGTITNGNHVQGCIVNNVLLIGDGVGSTRHTNNGTVFTNTNLAPVGQFYCQYQGRAYTTNGTNSVLSFSDANDITNWNTGGTSDSSSLTVPDEGAAGPMFVAGDRLVVTKTKGKMFNWDASSLVDMTTKYGPTMPWSIGSIDDFYLLPNQYGLFSYDGANKQLISNPVQRQFYNRQNTGMSGSQIGLTSTACGQAHVWNYFLTQGTITDDFTGRRIPNSILKYDYQKNTYLNWQFYDNPTSMLSYTDATNQKQFIFGGTAGQVFQLSSSATSDNGHPIQTDMVFLFSYAAQQETFSQTSAATISGMTYEKEWKWLRVYFNPGCEVNIQYAFANSFTYERLKWSETINTANLPVTNGAAQFQDGILEIRFPMDTNNPPRSRLLFLRIYDNSDNSQWTLYGVSIDANIVLIK